MRTQPTRKEVQTPVVDLLIVGAGFTGLRCAIEVKSKRPNWHVVIIEQLKEGSAASTRNAGFACFGSPTEILDDLEFNSRETVCRLIKDRYDGINYLRRELNDFNLPIYENGGWELFEKLDHYASAKQLTSLAERANAICLEAGLPGEVFNTTRYLGKTRGFFEQCIFNSIEFNFEPSFLAQALEQKATEMGVLIKRGQRVERIEKEENYEAVTSTGNYQTRRVALCNNGSLNQLSNFEIKPARAQVLLTSPIENLQLKGNFHASKGYFYFRNKGNRILFGGGRHLFKEEEFTDSISPTNKLQEKLESILRSQILPNEDFTIEKCWAGTMGFRADGNKEPLIGQTREGLFHCAGFGGMGVALSSIYSERLSRLILS